MPTDSTDNPATDTLCPICGGWLKHAEWATKNLRVRSCRKCGHTVAEHNVEDAVTATDYHEQYDQCRFMDSLEATRLRQSSLLLEMISSRVSGDAGILDVGAGRGFFLDFARRAGFQKLGGTDTSRIALDGLSRREFETVETSLDAGISIAEQMKGLSFRPQVATFLDVLEHIRGARTVEFLRDVVEALRPELRFVVIKVPVAEGVIYRISSLLCRIGLVAPFEQLYQVGTFPPHYHYFSHRSLPRLCDLIGLDIVNELRDPDFEPESLADRSGALRVLPENLVRLSGRVLFRAADIARMGDSMIVMAEVLSSRQGV